MNYFQNLLQTHTIVSFVSGMEKPEWKVLESLIQLLQGNIVHSGHHPNPGKLKTGDCVIVGNVQSREIKKWVDWGFITTSIGRFTETQKQTLYKENVVSLWDLEKNALTEIVPLLYNGFQLPREPVILLWSEKHKVTEILKRITAFLGIHLVITSNPDYALNFLEENKAELLVLDWDANGIEIEQTISTLLELKTKLIELPTIVGLKDFSRQNLFQDLSTGIKEFCSYLFSYREVIELFLHSLPFFIIKRQEIYETEGLPFLTCQYSPLNKKNTFSFTKTNPHRSEATDIIQYENHLNLFRNQFLWMEKYL